MTPSHLRRIVAAALISALLATGAPAFAAPQPAATSASLTGTVFAGDVATPLSGATVAAIDARGIRFASAPTGSDGAFTLAGLPAGRLSLALETRDGSFPVATPVTLAPGEMKGVHLALKADGATEEDKDRKKPGAYWTTGGKTSMIAVLVGFVVAGAVAINQQNDDSVLPASPSDPGD
ncbi:MAG TPA: carboxypeptidase-like regulatory domain-containing protein [Candidatus Polarisedimenticolaceae bacterium]|nr:carboxypeptidase-like regulatory domain-containing protein [Candidatus Polarisedimenticolaceae bacterium]